MKISKIIVLLGLVYALGSAAVARAALVAPYPYSTYITNITFNFSTATNYSKKYGTDGSDIWAYTWAADDNMYVAYGDGYGFQGAQSQKCSWGVSKMAGPFEQFTNTDIYYGPPGTDKGKIYSMLAISNASMNMLYAWDALQDAGDGNSSNAVLLSSSNMGVSWVSNWDCEFTLSTFQFGGFVDFGKNYSANTDGYIYLLGGMPASYPAGSDLARVPIANLTNMAQWQYLTNIDTYNHASWGKMSNAIPVFNDPHGFDFGGADYDAGLGRWLLSGYPTNNECDGGCFALYEGPTLWGPWRTITYLTNWDNLEDTPAYTNGNMEDFGFPAKYTSADGKSLGMFMSVYDTPNTNWNDQLLTMTVNLGVAPVPQPSLLAMPVILGGGMVLKGSNGLAGTSYRVMTSTNAALAFDSWTPVLTNNFAGDGSFSNIIALSSTNQQQFFRISTP